MNALYQELQHRLLNEEHALDTFVVLHAEQKNFRDSDDALYYLQQFYNWVETLANEDQRFWIKHATVSYGLEDLFLRELDSNGRLIAALQQPAFRQEVIHAFAPAEPQLFTKEILTIARALTRNHQTQV